jgi:hypothetical protein
MIVIFFYLNDPTTKSNSIEVENEGNRTIHLSFFNVPKQSLPTVEKPDFSQVVSNFTLGKINGSDVLIKFLSNDEAPMVRGNTFGFIHHANKWYSVGNVTNSYGFSNIKISKWDEMLPLTDLNWITVIENPFTSSSIISFERIERQWYRWDVIGTPRLLKEKQNGTQKLLISEFAGTHLQAPNVIVYQTNGNQLQQANIGDYFGGAPVRIVEKNNRYLFVVTRGKDVDEYFYDQGRLVRVKIMH